MADGSGSSKQYRHTYERFLKVVPSRNILVVTLASFAADARRELPELPEENLLLEPSARKTAPCMALAAYTLLSRDPEAVIVATPWDLVIRDEDLFVRTLDEAFAYVEENDVLMTLGIVPKSPDVNFGYIQVKEGRNAHLMAGPLQVKTFTEKPSTELAEVFVRTGEFFWNSGIFVWNLQTISEAFRYLLPEVADRFREGELLMGTEEEEKFIEQIFPKCPNISIDYGIMEKADNVFVIPSSFGWSDLGTWGSLYELSTKDANSNVSLHSEAHFYEAKGNIVVLEKGKTAIVQGVEDMIIAEEGGKLLVCKRAEEQRIKQFVSEL